MTGSIQTKKNRKNYYAVLNVYDENGKRKLKWIDTEIPVKGNNKRRADARLKEILVKQENEGIDLYKNDLFVDFMEQWLENHRHSIESSTYDGYKVVFNKHIKPFFESKKLRVKDVAPSHIQQYINVTLNSVSANTVHRHLANISKCLNVAVRQNIIAFNPVKRIDLPKKQKFTGAKYYNERQIEQLLACSKGDPLEIVILLTIFYGFRRSEVLGIKWDAIDFENRKMAIKHTVVQGHTKLHIKDSTKTNSSSDDLPLIGIVEKKLLQWKTQQAEFKHLQPNDYIDKGYICTQVDGSLIKPHYASAHFKLLLAKYNLPHIRFHDLRHSSAGYLKHLGFDLKDIQVWLRHGDIQTTANFYLSLDMEAKTNIAKSLDARMQTFKS